VAICSKDPLDDVVCGLPSLPLEGGVVAKASVGVNDLSFTPTPTLPPPGGGSLDSAARYIEAVVSLRDTALRVASVYVPNGQEVGSEKFAYKLAFLDRLQAHWRAQLTYHEIAVLGGDFNVAPYPIDVYDPEKLDGSVCYHPEERQRLRALMHLGLVDAFRLQHADARHYSWWDYRAGGYPRNHGMRIDHLLLSPEAADHLAGAAIDETPRGEEKPSDHAPVLATLKF
jgi:exodeoxyribonuclease-3